MKRFFLISTFLIGYSLTFSQSYNDSIAILSNEIESVEKDLNIKRDRLNEFKCSKLIGDLKSVGYPSSNVGQIIEHSAMVLNYVEKHEQANWVFHMILTDMIHGTQSRTNDFREDDLVKTGSAVEKDYFLKTKKENGEYEYDGFGYDRGHLAPSADFRWYQKALSESYYYSNMSPQLGDFNREKWAELEGFLRGYVVRNKRPLYVITGGVLTDDLPKVERSINKVSIPKYYYKIAYDSEKKEMIGFILPNQKCDMDLGAYACTVDSVEKLTGIDFFTKIDDSLESTLESKYTFNSWISEEESEVNVEPIKPSELPRNTFNTRMAKIYMDSGDKIRVCGTVVSTKKSGKGNVFLNLDKAFPNQIFSVSIWASDVVNFSYSPEIQLKRKQVCVTGKVGSFNGMPSMNISREEQIEIDPDLTKKR